MRAPTLPGSDTGGSRNGNGPAATEAELVGLLNRRKTKEKGNLEPCSGTSYHDGQSIFHRLVSLSSLTVTIGSFFKGSLQGLGEEP